MRLASFNHHGREGFGIVRDDHILDLAGEVATLRAALATWGLAGIETRGNSGGVRVPIAELTWLPPITDADKIICVGLNYHLHAKEAGMATPTRPSLFIRFGESQVAQGAPVVRARPPNSIMRLNLR